MGGGDKTVERKVGEGGVGWDGMGEGDFGSGGGV